MKESGRDSGRIVEDLGKVLGGVLGKRSSGSNRTCGTKYHNPKDKFCTATVFLNNILNEMNTTLK